MSRILIAFVLFIAFCIIAVKKDKNKENETKSSIKAMEFVETIPIWLQALLVFGFFGTVYYFAGIYGIMGLFLLMIYYQFENKNN